MADTGFACYGADCTCLEVISGCPTSCVSQTPCLVTQHVFKFHRLLVMHVCGAQLRWFASNQIRNVAALAGNVATASPISDMNPLLVACGTCTISAHPCLPCVGSCLHAEVRSLAFHNDTQYLFAGLRFTTLPLCIYGPPATGATLTLVHPKEGERVVPINEFFISYRTTAMRVAEGEFIKTINLPFTTSWEYVGAYKQARRREDDIALVGGTYRVRLQPDHAAASSEAGGGWRIADVGIAFSGMAAITCETKGSYKALVGRTWAPDVCDVALEQFTDRHSLPPQVPGGMPEFRTGMTASFFLKFFVRATTELTEDIEAARAAGEDPVPAPPTLSSRSLSAGVEYHRPVSFGTQTYDVPVRADAPSAAVPPTGVSGADGRKAQTADDVGEAGEQRHDGPEGGGQLPTNANLSTPVPTAKEQAGAVGKPVMHASGLLQTTGAAKYVDDIPVPAGTLEAALVLSPHPHARVLSIDASEAEAMKGVVGFYGAKAITGLNKFGVAVMDEYIFADVGHEVMHAGQMIGVVLAECRVTAQRAARAVQVEYEQLPFIGTIQEAIAAESFQGPTRHVVQGDVDAAFASPATEVLIEGEVYSGGQEHFYLEPGACLLVPTEEAEGMTVYTSTQAANKTQAAIAKTLGMDSHRVAVKIKRIGGGFGGKETRTVPYTVAAAVAAFAADRPVRLNLERGEDMQMTGQRHAFYTKYKAGFTSDGRFTGVDMQIYNNGGWSLDLSIGVLDRAVWSCDNAYFFPTARVMGRTCKTHMPSHTAYRGFGGPQGMIVAEQILEKAAIQLGIPADVLRFRNLVQEGQSTHYGELLNNVTIRKMWEEVIRSSQVTARSKQIEAFNAQNRFRKRGLAMVPTKYGINFGIKWMNQAGALVHVYTDGSVLVSHGGVEMGQGLNTKMIQVAAHTLGVPVHRVHIEETATDKVPNASPTAASASTDLYGGAVQDACDQLNARLKPYRESMPEGSTFNDIITKAFFDRVSLSAAGFYTVPRAGYDWDMVTDNNRERGEPFNYYTYGMCVSEVELDTLCGDFHVLRADLMMDLGNSVNPVIDIGQVEGAYTQGLGWCTMEECVWGDSQHTWLRPGKLLNPGPGTYKIPAFNDVPIDFRVSLLHNTPNPSAVYSSKAVGEPPFFMACASYFALRRAVASARLEFLRQPLASLSANLGPADEDTASDEDSGIITRSISDSGTLLHLDWLGSLDTKAWLCSTHGVHSASLHLLLTWKNCCVALLLCCRVVASQIVLPGPRKLVSMLGQSLRPACIKSSLSCTRLRLPNASAWLAPTKW